MCNDMRSFLILSKVSPGTAEKTLRTQPEHMCANGIRGIKTGIAFMKLDFARQVNVWSESWCVLDACGGSTVNGGREKAWSQKGRHKIDIKLVDLLMGQCIC